MGSVRFRQTPGANPKVGASACRWRSDALVFRFSADDKVLWSSFFGHADQMVGLCTGGQLGGRAGQRFVLCG
ncbi:hypothetical protein CEO83_24540 [Klebsiella pneumoniae]|nr:hypothetical protein CEP00_14450 [Klebsiella pneumoniae]OZJ78573.1 hypothetical protein CEO92_24645 [Klebsiella pneumoniae]OZJ84366.1 hypothetical protein CEO91_24365 [Klebsiella pneumoniae]OZK22208.1 hypothetical protein CEO84_24600 [Klebsiella pneumoniae]OZK27978.1 hypothetical protein CEO83_24540 [Klebsiella pneumoniae]